jgi:hypothetical protein
MAYWDPPEERLEVSRGASVRVRATEAEARLAATAFVDHEGWMPTRNDQPDLVFRRKVLGLLPDTDRLWVTLLQEGETVIVGFELCAAPSKNRGAEEDALQRHAEKLAKGFAERFGEPDGR